MSDVFVGLDHVAAITAMVAIAYGAVDQVLFTKRHEAARFPVVLTFQGTGLETTKDPD